MDMPFPESCFLVIKRYERLIFRHLLLFLVTLPTSAVGQELSSMSLASARLSRLVGINPTLEGPNCWNLALNAAGVESSIRYTSSYEMEFFSKSQLCKQLKNTEPRKKGDIGLIRRSVLSARTGHSNRAKNYEKIPYSERSVFSFDNMGGRDIHAFVLISSEQVLSKNGPNRNEPFQVQSLQSVYERYGVATHDISYCLNNEMDSSCLEKGTEFFRCSSLDAFVARSKISIDLLALNLELRQIENSLEEVVLANSVNNLVLQEKVLSILLRIDGFIPKMVSKKHAIANKDELFLLNSFKYKLIGTLDQLSLVPTSIRMADGLDGQNYSKISELELKVRSAFYGEWLELLAEANPKKPFWKTLIQSN